MTPSPSSLNVTSVSPIQGQQSTTGTRVSITPASLPSNSGGMGGLERAGRGFLGVVSIVFLGLRFIGAGAITRSLETAVKPFKWCFGGVNNGTVQATQTLRPAVHS